MTEIKLPSGRTLVGYDLCSSRAIADGSHAQMAFFVEDAKKDIAYLAALSRSAEAGKPVVKGLEWRTTADRHDAGSIVGRYTIEGRNPGYGLLVPAPVAVRLFIDLDAAKAAAQADYEARVRSALSTPADIEPVVACYQRRATVSGTPWVECPADEATDTFKQWTGFEYRALYAAPVADREPVSVPDDVLNDMLLARAPDCRWTIASILKEHGLNRRQRLDYMRAALAAAAPQPNPSKVDAEAWEKLCKLTFAVQHNPNCASPWLVRLPGKGPIDMKPYGDPLGLVRHQTGDILGFGKTLSDAARAALAAQGEKQP